MDINRYNALRLPGRHSLLIGTRNLTHVPVDQAKTPTGGHRDSGAAAPPGWGERPWAALVPHMVTDDRLARR
jgi:hypothetical protein